MGVVCVDSHALMLDWCLFKLWGARRCFSGLESKCSENKKTKNHIVLFVCLELVVARLWASLHIYYVLFYRVSGKFFLKLFVRLMSKKKHL